MEQAIFAAKEYLDESVIKLILGFHRIYSEKGLDVDKNWEYNGKIRHLSC